MIKTYHVVATIYHEVRGSSQVQFEIRALNELLARRNALEYVWGMGYRVVRFLTIIEQKEKHP
jgi:hypothetical protein